MIRKFTAGCARSRRRLRTPASSKTRTGVDPEPDLHPVVTFLAEATSIGAAFHREAAHPEHADQMAS
jgi:hypothetical protein